VTAQIPANSRSATGRRCGANASSTWDGFVEVLMTHCARRTKYGGGDGESSRLWGI
jgi:hypothetical protein